MRTARSATILSTELSLYPSSRNTSFECCPTLGTGRAMTDGLVEFEASRRFGVPDPTDRRLVEFGDDARATTCSLWMISPRRRIGAQGTSAASRRSSHSAVVCCMMYSAILLMRAVALTERAAVIELAD